MSRLPEFDEHKILALIFEGLGIERGYFLDLGAAGQYSNTDWLLERGWEGLQVDRRPDWRGRSQHVTIMNIGDLMRECPYVSFLSIDLDGLDYWILRKILGNGYHPRVVCIEYNQAKIGPEDVQIYDPNYIWEGEQDFGSSWQAIDDLCSRYRYVLAFKNLVNCIFVWNENPMPPGIIKRAAP